MYLMQIYQTKEHSCSFQSSHGPYRSAFPVWKPTFLCLFATSPLKQNMQCQLQLELVRWVWVKNMMKTKRTGDITQCCEFFIMHGSNAKVCGVYSHWLESSLRFRDDQQVQLCPPLCLLRASSANNGAPCVFNEAVKLFSSHYHTSCWLQPKRILSALLLWTISLFSFLQ